jgi:hypothetical protein
VAVAAAGFEPIVRRLPDSDDPGLLAVLDVGAPARLAIAALECHIDRRRTNRRAYRDWPVPLPLINDIVSAAEQEGMGLVALTGPAEVARTLALTTIAEQSELADPQYVAELRAWTTDDPRRRDGVQASSVPYRGGADSAPAGGPVRQFDLREMGWLPALRGAPALPTLVLIGSADDDAGSWLRAGEALERVWLELTGHGYWASPLGQVVEVRETHDLLRTELANGLHPQILLRIGQAPEVVATPRRLAGDVIAVEL